jgi:hypothetical protein
MEPVIIFICVFAAVGISTVIAASARDLLLIRKNALHRRSMSDAECIIVKPTEL